jgi:transcriptional regulator with XRE-family HTH domain
MEPKPSPRSLNLLRAHRRCTAFSQDEIAFLLGIQSGATVCRYEQMERDPELKTALAFEAIYGRPISDLFPALFEQVRAIVKARAKILAKRALIAPSSSLMAQKRKAITGIINKEKKRNGKK